VRPVEQSCYWLATRGRSAEAPLQGPRDADIAIIGAGFTGLWTANRLKELDPQLDVVVLEQGIAAYGASGRNAGMLGEGLDHSHDLAIRHFGLDEARLLAGLGRDNLEDLVRFVRERGIDCDLERNGLLTVALLPEHLAELRDSEASARRLGLDYMKLLDGPATRAEVRSPRYQGGLINPHCGILNPVKLVEGLKREAARQGVAIFEQTRVEAVVPDGPGVLVRAAGGRVRARRAILATNAYTHQIFPRLLHRFIPLYDYILVSEPLDAAQREAIGWKNRQSVSDTRTFFKYYRLTADHRVLWGTSEAAYYRGNRVDRDCDHSERHYGELRDSFRRHFPDVGELDWPYAWGGPICSTTRFTPFFGAAHGGRILYGLGYTGHGIASTHLAGRILAHMALARPSPLLDLQLVRRKPFPYPPEPFRALAVRAVSRDLRRVDAGRRPSMLLRCLDAIGIGLSS
jgi:glycine/D-amino acid oxidase-like deaminating enzyme